LILTYQPLRGHRKDSITSNARQRTYGNYEASEICRSSLGLVKLDENFDYIKAMVIQSLVSLCVTIFQIACLTRNFSKRKFQHLQNRKEKRMNKKAILN
jgi:hypothetical protein